MTTSPTYDPHRRLVGLAVVIIVALMAIAAVNMFTAVTNLNTAPVVDAHDGGHGLDLGEFADTWSPDYRDAYLHDRVCFAPINGDRANVIGVVDTFDRWSTHPNAGTTSMTFTACHPTAAPPGYTVGSGGLIPEGDDPLGHIPPGPGHTPDPVADALPPSPPVEAPAPEVGPLVEPPINGAATATATADRIDQRP